VPVFSRIAVEEMRPLADIAQTVPMTLGSALFTESAPPALWLILSGEVSIEDGEGPRLTARPGDIIGSLGMLSGQPLGRSADVLRGGTALRIDRDDLFDLLGQRPELMRQLFEGMFAVGPEAPGQH
jgi:CRP-like cAMP-binding protein